MLVYMILHTHLGILGTRRPPAVLGFLCKLSRQSLCRGMHQVDPVRSQCDLGAKEGARAHVTCCCLYSCHACTHSSQHNAHACSAHRVMSPSNLYQKPPSEHHGIYSSPRASSPRGASFTPVSAPNMRYPSPPPIPDAVNSINHMGILEGAGLHDMGREGTVRPIPHLLRALPPLPQAPTAASMHQRMDAMHWQLNHTMEVGSGWRHHAA